jgi:peptidoglycan/LPS O-acetylase OafA/YrhL
VKPVVLSDEILPLTGLRFVAALYVFIFHIHLRWPLASESVFLSNLIGQGAVGMSLFFVLSGFVLARRYGDGSGNYRSYLINRFSRIYPVYLVAALLTLPWIGVSLVADSAYGLARQIATLGTLIASDLLLIQAWFPQLFHLWNNSGSWSISVEAFCYALLPFILIGLHRRSERTIKYVAFAAYALAVIPGLTLVLFYGDQGQAFYSLPIYRLPEFVIGVCTALAANRLVVSSAKTAALQLISMCLLIAYLGFVGSVLPMWVTHNWIVLPVIALTIFSTAQSFGVLSKLLSLAPVVWAGKISYSFYSFQLFVLLFLKSHHHTIVEIIPALKDNRLLLLASLGVLMVLAAAGYHFIEEPMRLWIKRASVAKSWAKPASMATPSVQAQ